MKTQTFLLALLASTASMVNAAPVPAAIGLAARDAQHQINGDGSGPYGGGRRDIPIAAAV
jgi:hypothetical protein